MVRLLKIFNLSNFADGEDATDTATPVVSGGADATESIATESGAQPDSSTNELDTYIGSKDVNPEQRPLKKFDRSMYKSKEDIDQFIKFSDGHLFMDKVDKKDIKTDNVSKIDTKDDKKPVSKDVKDGVQRAEKGKEIEGEIKPEDFLKEIEMTLEQFQALPPKVQERLTETNTESPEIDAKYKKLEDTHSKLIGDINELKKDPVIAARLEERATGKNFVARELPPVSVKEARGLAELAGDPEQFETELNALIIQKAHDVLKIERGVVERAAVKAEREAKAAQVLQKIFEIEPRLGITEKDVNKLADESHPEHEKLFGKGGLMEMLSKKRYSPMQLIEKGPEELIREFAASKGWDKERDDKLVKKGKQALLENLRNAGKVARTLDVGKKVMAQKSVDSGNGFDRETLISEIASGRSGNWQKLITDAGDRGKNDMVAQLTEIYEEGLRQRTK
jgi:hypothetical protein